MRLKRLYLQGYKTFANRTELVFDSGITAVVGPNGSGKSNIADAIRWVLGEQSFSELRGKKTTDMIFAGSQTRPKAGMASVTLILDNSAGWLPIEYNEIEITRRAYRSGENEYLLNGNRVRLRDVRDLLATSGLAQRTYTMIGQGLIDSALSLRSEERRALFEEAAGISHYKERRAETLRRLQETQRNVERVHDLLVEIEPRLKNLKRQATRAQNYEQLAVDLRHLLRQWYGYRWHASKHALRLVRQEVAQVEVVWKRDRGKASFLQEQLADLRVRVQGYEQKIVEKSAEKEQLRQQWEKLSRHLAILTERQTLISRQIAEISAELPDLTAQHRQAQAELDHALQELTAVQTQLEGERKQLAQFEATFQAQQAELQKRQTNVRHTEKQVTELQRALSLAEGQLSQLCEQLAEREKQPPEMGGEVDGERIVQLEGEMAQWQQKSAELRDQRTAHNRLRQQLLDEIKQLRHRQNEENRQLTELNKEIAGLAARAELLNQLRQKGQKIQGKVAVLGRLTTLFEIPPRYQEVVTAVLGGRLGAVWVADEATLWKLVADNGPEGVTAFVAEQLATPAFSAEGDVALPVIGRLYDLITPRTDPPHPILALLFGGVWVTETAKIAYQLGRTLPVGMIAVSLDGTLVETGGLVRVRPTNQRENWLAQERDYQLAMSQLQQKQDGVANWQQRSHESRGVIDQKQSELDRLGDEERTLNRREQSLRQSQLDAQRDLDRMRQQVVFWQQQQANHQKEIGRLQERVTTLEQSIAAQKERWHQAEQAAYQAKIALADLPLESVQQQRTQQQQSLATTKTIADGRRAVADSRRATLGQLETRLNRQRQLLATLQNQQAEIDLAQETSRLQQLQEGVERLTNAITPLQAVKGELQSELSKLDGELSVATKLAHRIEEQYTELRFSLNQKETQIDHLREQIRGDLGVVDLPLDEDEEGQTPLPLGEVVELLPNVEELPEGIESAIQKRRVQMQQMGMINPDAPEEYRTTQERFDFLTGQVADLQKTEEQLRGVIGELDVLTSQEFGKTVQEVNKVFGGMFESLFGGGSAELQLTNPDNLTISGVEIIAQLPRKKPQELGLLSGGERALTAAALIFSLLKVTPPPFCVMDEVDAALDEANINRFRDALRGLMGETQIIIITHNRGTVQAANTLYGVSMGGDGVSQLLSIKPEEYLKSEA